MLMPKKSKWRKQSRGRMCGQTKGGDLVSFGEFGLKALEPCWITSRQIEIARRYVSVLSDSGVDVPEAWRADGVALIRFPLLVKNPERLVLFFRERHIEVGQWFDNAIAPFPADPGKYNYSPGQCPEGELIGQHIVNLPAHNRMAGSDVDRACSCLGEYLITYPEEAEFAASAMAVDGRVK